MSIKLNLSIFFLLLGVSLGHSQSSYIKTNHPAYHAYDRINILTGVDTDIHTSFKHYYREDMKNLVLSYSEDSISNCQDLNFLRKEFLYTSSDSIYSGRSGLWSTFYKNPAHLFELETEDFNLIVDPSLNLRIGKESEAAENIFLNQRGIELYGTLDKKLYFYTSIQENQSNFLNYITPFIQKYKAIPGYANYKDFQSSIIKSFSGLDYGNAQAYLGYKISTHVNLELGHNKHFIGNGMRSLLLSDFGQNYFYLKMGVRVWKLQYQSIFAELSSIASRQTPNNVLLPKKYMASHYLNFKPNSNLEIGLFESVIFSRENHFELQYLNPLILYRSAEHFLDSPDNVLLGLNVKLNLFKKLSIYSQFVLDDIQLNEFFKGTNFWGNKFGYQLGIKYFDLFNIKYLDSQIELNRVRPYTYSHFQESDAIPAQSVSSYSHFNQALAHPLGANFTEVIFKLRYQAMQRLVLEGRYIYSIVGRDDGGNYGSDILLVNLNRVQEYDVRYHQGARSNINMIDFNLSYELFHDFYIDLQMILRRDENVQLGNLNTTFFTTGIRYNIYTSKIDY